MFRAIFAAAAVLLGVLVAGESGAPVFPPGMRIGLVPPASLTVSRRFPGIEDSDRHVTISILDLPAAAYDRLCVRPLPRTSRA